MLTEKKIIGKLEQIERRYTDLRFEKIADVPVEYCETREHFRADPTGPRLKWRPAPAGTKWGGNWITAWFRGDARLPKSCNGKRIFVRAKTGGETLFIVDGQHRGVFDGWHPVVMMTGRGAAGRSYHLAFEAYAGHTFPGAMPQDTPPPVTPKCRTFDGIELLLEREDVSAFVFDLKVLRSLMKSLDENSLRRNRITAELARVFAAVDMLPLETGERSWLPKLAGAREIMRPLLECTNGPTAPFLGIIGHSHIDTAWLWPLAETWRKCARTFSSMLNLMEQYPELMFLQSQPCQTDVIRREYPAILDGIRKMVKAGRWEPNGGMWVEPDCNIPSGEAFVRQLLAGQQATREMFGFTSDTLWLPDVFGYSAALPQILRGAGIEFFCTTKIGWNDTTRFPYDTFTWRGIDGTPVVAHFNAVHCWPDPETLIGQWNWVQHKDVQDRRYCAFGFGDGGGGPMAEMCEMARRVADLEGCPRTKYMTISEFMKSVRDQLALPEFAGELYLEYHRGTLTSISEIKRGNRKTELALRDAELLCTAASLNGAGYPKAKLDELWKTLLTNQFHDILPGSSIAEVNDEAVATLARCVAEADALADAAMKTLAGSGGGEHLLIANTLSWDRGGEIALDGAPEKLVPADGSIEVQRVQTPDGVRRLVLGGFTVPALGGAVVPMKKGAARASAGSPFTVDGDSVETPHARLRFDGGGRIASLVDKSSGRQIVQPGGTLNAFILGEDVPEAWDNWDIDADQQRKMRPAGELIGRRVIANGPLQLRIRCEYRLTAKSRLTQDVVLHAATPQIDFETVLEWGDVHTLLKTAFQLAVLADSARHEIQFGHVERPTHRNLPQDRARFEVAAHKWTDLSENGFGVALLNDSKYGVGVLGGELTLTLIKSGTHPDGRGDAGRHVFAYSLLPHACPFSVESVVRPAYELNVPVRWCKAGSAARGFAGIVSVDAPNVIVEAVKRAENGSGLVVRLYEAGKTGTNATVRFSAPVKSVGETNLLEEDRKRLKPKGGAVSLYMRPFEIKTLVCEQ